MRYRSKPCSAARMPAGGDDCKVDEYHPGRRFYAHHIEVRFQNQRANQRSATTNMKLVFATNNRHKLDEVRKITSGYTEIVSLSEINCHEDIPETAETLEGNALQKARYIKEHFGYDCFADDTGLEVEAQVLIRGTFLEGLTLAIRN